MKKIAKSTLVVALIAAAAFGGVKTYGAYAPETQSDLLLSENVEALSGNWLENFFVSEHHKNFAELKSYECVEETTTTSNQENKIEAGGITENGIGTISASTSSTQTTTSKKSNKTKTECETCLMPTTCDRREQRDCNGNPIYKG